MTATKTRWFETPRHGWGYSSRFYYKVFQSLKRQESLALDSQLPTMKTNWYLESEQLQNWQALLDYQQNIPQPFTLSAPAGVWALMQVLEDIGICFSRIMHMNSAVQMMSSDGFKANQHYSTIVSYLGAKAYSKTAVLIRFQSVIKDVKGSDIMTVEDELYVAGLDQHYVAKLTLPEDSIIRRATRPLLLDNAMADQLTLTIKRTTGAKYGKLSGDLNPLHISSIGAKLFGHKQAFVQGLCVLNMVVARLGSHWGKSVQKLKIDFIRPVVQPSKLRLLCTLDRFELIDTHDTLLTAGDYRTSA